MKKITLVSLASFGFLLLCSAVAVLLENVIEKDAVLALAAGIIILLFSAVVAFIVKEKPAVNLLCFMINAIALGFLIRAWYINRGFSNTLPVMALISLAAVLYLWAFFALSRIPFIYKSTPALVILLIAYAILSIIGYVIAVLKTETTYVSTYGYYMIIEFAFIFAMCLEVNSPRELMRNLTLSTYSVFGVAVIVAVFVIVAALGGDADCDFDCCSGADCCDCGVSSEGDTGKKRRMKKEKTKL